MKRAVLTFSLAAPALLLAAPPAAADGATTAVLLPAESDDLDAVTLGLIDGAVREQAEALGWSAADAALVAGKRPGSCVSPSCAETADFLSIGNLLGAQAVLRVTAAKDASGGVALTIGFYDVAASTGKVETGAAPTSGLLVKVKGMVKGLLTPAQPPVPPAAPQPAAAPPAQPHAAASVAPPGAGGSAAAAQPEAAEKKEEKKKPKGKPDQSGRVNLIIASTLFAMGEGTGILLSAKVLSWKPYLPVILLGGAAGAVLALGITWKLKVTTGDALMYETIIAWCIANGLLIPPAARITSYNGIALGGVIGGAIGFAGGVAVAALTDPSPGDALFMSVVGFWTAAYGEMICGFVLPDDARGWTAAALAGLDVGLLAGGIASYWLDISAFRIGVLSMVGLGGAAIGALGGLAFVAKKNPDDGDWRSFDGILLAGTTIGLIAGVFVSAIAEEKRKDKGKKVGFTGKPFLAWYDREGWKLGVPGIAPLAAYGGEGSTNGVIVSLAGGEL